MFIDFAGLFLRKMYFLVIDAHSKWDEVFQMAQTTATKKLEILRQLFASYRFPEQIVSDNGPHVISEDFHQFITRHICCAPYHPASNGLVECFVHTFKEALDTQSRTLLARQVMVKNMHPGENQIPGLVLGQLGPVSFLVDEASHRSSQNL